MKIAILFANGKYGKPLVDEALKRGHDVTVFERFDNETAATKVVKKAVPDITAEDLAGFDAVIDASAVWTKEFLPLHYQYVMHLCDVLSGTDTKFLIVGGEGARFSDEDMKKWLGTGTSHEIKIPQGAASTRWFGSNSVISEIVAEQAGEYAVEALGVEYATMPALFAALRKRKDVNWIFMEPSCEIDIAVMSTTVNLPYNDYASDMLDEIESGIHYQQRVGTTC